MLDTRARGAARPRHTTPGARSSRSRADEERAGDARAAQHRAVRRARPSAARRWPTRSDPADVPRRDEGDARARCGRSRSNTEPLIRDLDPVLDDLQPTLASLRAPVAGPREPLRQPRPADRRRRRRPAGAVAHAARPGPDARRRPGRSCASSTRSCASSSSTRSKVADFMAVAAGGARRHPLDAARLARATATCCRRSSSLGERVAARADAHADNRGNAYLRARRQPRPRTRRSCRASTATTPARSRRRTRRAARSQGRRRSSGVTQRFPQVARGRPAAGWPGG